MSEVGMGYYAGIPYILAQKEGKLYIGLNPNVAMTLASKGANLHLLDDIGDQDPDDVMAALLDSIPE